MTPIRGRFAEPPTTGCAGEGRLQAPIPCLPLLSVVGFRTFPRGGRDNAAFGAPQGAGGGAHEKAVGAEGEVVKGPRRRGRATADDVDGSI
jgi:hypothetical protein